MDFPDPITRQFATDGYVRIKGLLDPVTDLAPLVTEGSQLLDGMLHHYLAGRPPPEAANSGGFAERFAALLGFSKGLALHHLDPVLNLFSPDYRWQPELPEARPPSMFALMRQAKLLDVIASVIGGEITASPIYHVNLKLAAKHLQLAEGIATAHESGLSDAGFYHFQVGQTAWHRDAVAGLRDSHESRIVNAWIPLTTANEENGCLLILPGSHREGVYRMPDDAVLARDAVAIPAEPGDVVLLDNKVLHASLPNRSDSSYRWAYNFRYLPTGQATGRPFLPAFVARSKRPPETELRDPNLWAAMWRSALAHLSSKGLPVNYLGVRKMRPEAARKLSSEWADRVPDYASWLAL